MTVEVDQVVEGLELPPFVRTADFHAFNRYAAVNDEFVDIHMDDEAGRAAGYPGAFGMGNLTFAWMHCLVRDWLGDAGRIVRLECQFRGPALRGDTVTCKATVTRVFEEGRRDDGRPRRVEREPAGRADDAGDRHGRVSTVRVLTRQLADRHPPVRSVTTGGGVPREAAPLHGRAGLSE